jgi:hypothetical protein
MTRWLPVVGYEENYEVSDDGRVRNRKGLILSPALTHARWGYHFVNLSLNDVKKTHTIHKLVLTAFVGPRPSPELQCCHANGDRFDNRVENLRWDTPLANSNDKEWPTHCPQGHEYTPDNISWWRGWRKCRTCHRERERARKAALRETKKGRT